ncbi:MAG: DNA recombination/repair protein RecA [Cystobacterineae bacterium]|nr:DNA recombination/repair protein RecA [Cystobacterineae bacterium]
MSAWSEKLNRLTEVLRGVEKQFGRGTAVQLSGQSMSDVTGGIPTGSLGLDHALGCGGYPRGRIIELFGHEGSGKSSLALQSIAAAQAQGGVAAFVDAEHSFSVGYAQKLGIETDKLVLVRASTAEQSWEVIERLIQGGVDLIVVDSIAALLPKAELEAEQPVQATLHAQMLSHAIRKLAGPLFNSSCALLLLNQLRYTTSPTGTGLQASTPGGVALKFFSSIRCHVENLQVLKSASKATGMLARVSIVKNKCAPPAEPIEFELYFEGGICRATEALKMGLSAHRVKHEEAGLFCEGVCLGRSVEEAIAFLKAHPEELPALISP